MCFPYGSKVGNKMITKVVAEELKHEEFSVKYQQSKGAMCFRS